MKREGEQLDCLCVLKLIPINNLIIRTVKLFFKFILVRPGFKTNKLLQLLNGNENFCCAIYIYGEHRRVYLPIQTRLKFLTCVGHVFTVWRSGGFGYARSKRLSTSLPFLATEFLSFNIEDDSINN